MERIREIGPERVAEMLAKASREYIAYPADFGFAGMFIASGGLDVFTTDQREALVSFMNTVLRMHGKKEIKWMPPTLPVGFCGVCVQNPNSHNYGDSPFLIIQDNPARGALLRGTSLTTGNHLPSWKGNIRAATMEEIAPLIKSLFQSAPNVLGGVEAFLISAGGEI